MSRLYPLLFFLCFYLFGEDKKVIVKCEAISIDDRPRTNYPFGVEDNSPELIILGTSSLKGTKREGDNYKFNTTIKEIFFGGSDKEELNFVHPWRYPEAKVKVIIALVKAKYPSVEGEEWQHKYSLNATPENIEAARALGRARLAYYTHSSDLIFSGRELSLIKDEREVENKLTDYLRKVKINKVIHGPNKLEEAQAIIEIAGFTRRSNAKVKLNEGEMIYFIREVGRYTENQDKFVISAAVPARLLQKVTEIKKNNQYFPVKENIREILFTGSTEKALFIMGSDSMGAVKLMTRTLLNRDAKARLTAVNYLKKEIKLFRKDSAAIYLRIRNIIRYLSLSDKGQKELEELLKSVLDYIPGNPEIDAKLPVRKYSTDEKKYTDTNHTVLWLLQNLSKKYLLSNADRIIKTFEQAEGRWKQELKLAIEDIGLNEMVELNYNMKKFSEAKAIRVSASVSMQGRHVAFTNKGKIIINDKIYSKPLGVLEREIEKPKYSSLLLSPDSSVLYAIGVGAILKLDYSTGKILMKISGHKDHITRGSITADGKMLMTVSNFGDSVHLNDTTTGKLLRKFTLFDKRTAAAISSDGKYFAWNSNKEIGDLTIENLNDNSRILLNFATQSICKILFSPDNKYLVVVTYGFPKKGVYSFFPSVSVYDINTGFKKTEYLTITGEEKKCSEFTVSPDGKYAAIGNEDGKVWVMSFPDLKNLEKIIKDESCKSIRDGQLAFSLDSTMLAVGSDYSPARFYKTGNRFEQVINNEGHSGKIEKVFFSKDGRHIYSYGDQGFVCIWDSINLNFIKRIKLPDGFKFMGIHPDGRYAVCFDTLKEENSFRYGKGQENPSKIIDVNTGKVLSQPILPMGSFRTRIHWINDDEALVTTWNDICRFNFRTGKILKKIKVDNSSLGNGNGEITEDGKYLFISKRIGGKFTTRSVALWYIDHKTGKDTNKLEAEQVIKGGYNARGLIPGGKYFYYGDPGMTILSRKTGKTVIYKKFPKADLLKVTFSEDGRKYAVINGGRIYIDSRGSWDPGTESILQVFDTETGKMLFASSLKERWVQDLKFSKNSNRILIATENTLETKSMKAE